MTYIRIDQRKLGYRGMGAITLIQLPNGFFQDTASGVVYQPNQAASMITSGQAVVGATSSAGISGDTSASQNAAVERARMAAAAAAQASLTAGGYSASARQTAAAAGGSIGTAYLPELDKTIPVYGPPAPGAPLNPPDINDEEAAYLESLLAKGQKLNSVTQAVLGYYRHMKRVAKGGGSGSILDKIKGIFGGGKSSGGKSSSASSSIFNAAADATVSMLKKPTVDPRTGRPVGQMALKVDEGPDVGTILLGLGGIAAVGGLIYFATKKKKRPLGRNN